MVFRTLLICININISKWGIKVDYKERAKCIEALPIWFEKESFQPRYLLTLTYRNNNITTITRERVKKSCKKFTIDLNRKVFGKRSRKALRLATFIEGGDEFKKAHVHILLEIPELGEPEGLKRLRHMDLESFKEILRDKWVNSDPLAGDPIYADASQESWFKEVYDENGLVGYLNKERRFKELSLEPSLTFIDGRRIKGR